MAKNIQQPKVRNGHTKKLKELLIGRIDQAGNFRFTDDSWYFSKKHKDSLPKGSYTITFYQVPYLYRDWVKYYALLCTSSTSHTAKKCLNIARFLKFIDSHYSGLSLDCISRKHVNAFEYELKLSDSSVNNKQTVYAAM